MMYTGRCTMMVAAVRNMGAFGNHLGFNGQPGGMVIVVPLLNAAGNVEKKQAQIQQKTSKRRCQ